MRRVGQLGVNKPLLYAWAGRRVGTTRIAPSRLRDPSECGLTTTNRGAVPAVGRSDENASRLAPVSDNAFHPSCITVGYCHGQRSNGAAPNWKVEGCSRLLRSKPGCAPESPRVDSLHGNLPMMQNDA